MNAEEIERTSVADAMDLVSIEVTLTVGLLRELDEAEWDLPTVCTGWTVRDVVAHVIGQYEGLARPHRLVRRVRAARRMPGVGVLDGHNQLQVAQRTGLAPQRLLDELQLWGGRAVRAGNRIPALVRGRMKLSILFPEAVEMPEDSLDYLLRVIGPRDPWMHRIDIATATGRKLTPDDHDATMIAQIAHDLSLAWSGPPVRLRLAGPIGGEWTSGTPNRPQPSTVMR